MLMAYHRKVFFQRDFFGKKLEREREREMPKLSEKNTPPTFFNILQLVHCESWLKSFHCAKKSIVFGIEHYRLVVFQGVKDWRHGNFTGIAKYRPRAEELCRGCLTDRAKAQSNQYLPHDELPTAMRQIFSAAFYLHQKNIIHRVSRRIEGSKWKVKTENVVTSGYARGWNYKRCWKKLWRFRWIQVKTKSGKPILVATCILAWGFKVMLWDGGLTFHCGIRKLIKFALLW